MWREFEDCYHNNMRRREAKLDGIELSALHRTPVGNVGDGWFVATEKYTSDRAE